MDFNPNGASDISVNLENPKRPVNMEARLLVTFPYLDE